MAGPVIYTRWLKPGDARAIARLERKAYARNQRNGRRGIASDLRAAEEDATNMSLGLFHGTKLVGFLLAYICHDRAAVFEDFEVHHDDAVNLRGRSVYVEDVVVLPRYSRSIFLLFTKWAREHRRRCPELPLDAFCEPALLERWTKYSRGFRHKGMELDRSMKVTDLSRDQDWYWFSWRQLGTTARAAAAGRPGTRLKSVDLPARYEARLLQTQRDCERIRGDWERLVESMPEPGAFMTWDFLLTWWRHHGLSRRLLVIVLYCEDRIVGIAPLMICPKRILGVYRWRLEMLGDASLMERPGLLAENGDEHAEDLLWRCAIGTCERWDAAYLREQVADLETHPFVRGMQPGGFLCAQSDIREAPHVRTVQPWQDYFAGRSRALRKGFRRKLRALGKLGEVRFVGFRDCPDAAEALERYLDVESRSWKGTAGFGVTGTHPRLAFYRELVQRLGPAGKVHFRFLYVDDLPIAATFGLFESGRFASVEICHDRAYERYSPGFILTGLELQECHDESDYLDFDFLCGTHENKTPWSKDMYRSQDIYVLPGNWWGRANRFVIFGIKPAVKRALHRLGIEQTAYDWFDRIRKRLG